MSRYTGPVCRLCRRETASNKAGEKIKLFLKGDRCLSRKCAVERRGTAPGQKTAGKQRTKISEYGRQLREKQKMRRYYGVHETQWLPTQISQWIPSCLPASIFVGLESRRRLPSAPPLPAI